MKTTSISRAVKAFVSWQLHGIRNQLFRLGSNEKKYSKFHSQFGEDRWIFEHINLPEKGVFVDVGAGHPIALSNTYFFERNGWTGICIDADPAQYERLKKARANVEWTAISSKEGELEFSQSYLPALSSTLGKKEHNGVMKIPFKDAIRVPSLKLETLLAKYNIGAIDLLNIDVEGTELEVWRSFDYKKHQPKVVIIEYYTLGLSNSLIKVKGFFSDLPYQLVHTTCSNLIFLSSVASSQCDQSTSRMPPLLHS